MKKTLVLIFSIVAFSSLKAQVQFGVKAGVNISNLTISGNDPGASSPSAKTSFHAGLLASLPIAESLTLQPEVLYSAQGAKGNELGTDFSLDYDYINVPVLIKYNHSSGLFAETGPQAGFLISSKFKAGGQSMDYKDYTQSFDFSWAFGIGYKIPDVNVGIDLRYNLGITNTIKDNTTDGSAKNSVFQFGIFYLFGGGGND